MTPLAHSFAYLAGNAGELIDTIRGLFHGFGELLQAMRTILRLIGTLAGG